MKTTGNAPAPDRKLAGYTGNERGGFRCHHYDETDAKFTTEYEWKHCIGMQVGETYEVHWPHSSQGACGTVHQYQTPFYDGVFCNLPLETFLELVAANGPQVVASNVGVQGQIFTIVNDEKYFYPDLIRGWVVEPELGMGSDIAKYTGSTTGTSRDNNVCSNYSPITWQVDRKCHMISASSFDKLCYDMKNQLDDMSDDLYPHGSRVLVNSTWTANNQYDKDMMPEPANRNLRSHSHAHHAHNHDHHGHDHSHDHHEHDHSHHHDYHNPNPYDNHYVRW